MTPNHEKPSSRNQRQMHRMLVRPNRRPWQLETASTSLHLYLMSTLPGSSGFTPEKGPKRCASGHSYRLSSFGGLTYRQRWRMTEFDCDLNWSMQHYCLNDRAQKRDDQGEPNIKDQEFHG